MIKINPVPEDIQDMQLEESICQSLSLTGTPVSAGDLEACHRMRQRDWVIIKFSSRKKEMALFFWKKSLIGKSDELKNLGFTSAKLFLSDSMGHENHLNKFIDIDLKNLAKWLNANKIYLNVSKTEMVLFRPKRKSIDFKIKLHEKMTLWN